MFLQRRQLRPLVLLTRRVAALGTCLALAGCSKDDSATGPGTLPPSTPGTFVADAAAAELSVSDIARFWAAVDEYKRSKSANAFQALYLGHASPGLVDFVKARSITAASLADMVDRAPTYFAASRVASTALAGGAVDAQVRSAYSAMKSIYPETLFPTVTFAFGRFSTAGTIRNNRILLGVEFYYPDNAAAPLDELQSFQKTNVKPLGKLPIIVAHELVHILQSRASGIFGKSTLLEQALAEGIADFVGERASGDNINAWLRPYGLAHEHELWVQFQSQMQGTDVTQWLYNQGSASSNAGDRPGDLGYFMGYRIAQAYYDRATDKARAIKELIEVQNASALLAASGYNP